MYLLRGFPIWLVIVFAESAHGALRMTFLAPLIGDFPARRIALFTGMLLIFLIAYFFIRFGYTETGWKNTVMRMCEIN
jgi:antibiotic biosynthesis monooxygenase (ABM) superfamily enzyme